VKAAVEEAAIAVAALSGVVGIYGAWRWFRVETAPRFWPALRAAQLAEVVFAAYTGVLAASGHSARSGLFYLYALLPLAINVLAEQLRIATAESVLAARGIASARDVGALPADEQRSIVIAILRRELGVMAASALVVVPLLIRAAGTAAGI
jgi:hypothetical protein